MWFKLERLLSKEIEKYIIDWAEVSRIIEENKDYINEFGDDDSALSDCFYYFNNRGKYLVKLIQIFLENGFDVSANGGKNGSSCLHQLCWHVYDQYVLDAAELLLDAGADSTLDHYEDEHDEYGVLDSIDWRLGYWNIGEHDLEYAAEYFDIANIYEAYYLMIKRVQAHLDYHGIRAFRRTVGGTVYKVEEVIVHDTNKKDGTTRRSLVFHVDDMLLEARDCVEFIVNPYIKENAISIKDVTEGYKPIIGAKIKSLRYLDSVTARLSIDNGYKIVFKWENQRGNIVLEEPDNM
ncbi:hypothetical protein [Pseudobutyrivibrio sp.]|uniref:hypothetical protein n=1 Tax=Pseudobutyrivibrio sp. TaxID=2014367 RepID=UPI0025D06076|nr:hypothetical protein [Pseudobutyrivibrio sp.]MBR5649063.1 hypothetical protein [Pseudobutyrivibrio sp.]